MIRRKVSVISVSLVFLSAFAFLALGCKPPAREELKKRDTKSKDILARVGPNIITKKDLLAAIDEMSPYTRQRYLTLQRKKQLLEDLIRFEVLVLEAKKQGLEKDPEVKRALQRALIQIYLRRIMSKIKPKEISESEMRRYYLKNYRKFNRPEKRRARQIFIAIPPGATPEKIEQVRQKAEKIYQLAKNTSSQEFEKLVVKYSEDPLSKEQGGDIGYSIPTSEGGTWHPAISKAVFSLKKVGDVSPPVKTEKGFHILRLEEIVPPLRQSFSQVREIIRHRLMALKREQAYLEYIEKLKKKYRVQINYKLLNSLRNELQKIEEKTPKKPNKKRAPSPKRRPTPPTSIPSTTKPRAVNGE